MRYESRACRERGLAGETTRAASPVFAGALICGCRTERCTITRVPDAKETTIKRATKARTIGRYIVADPKICHGKPTFRGTRVLVADVLDQVAAGMAWQTIIDEWNGSITKAAIREAIQLASEALLRHADEFAQEPIPV